VPFKWRLVLLEKCGCSKSSGALNAFGKGAPMAALRSHLVLARPLGGVGESPWLLG
jgi:hypothetical protein